MNKPKILHVLYGGLGGHGSVFFSFVEADIKNEFEYQVLFYGIEEPKTDYISQCKKLKIPFEFQRKNQGLDLGFYFKVFKKIINFKPNWVFLHGSSLILPAFFYRIFFGKKIIVRETQANKLKTKADWFFMFWSIILANFMVFLSKEYEKEVKKAFLKIFFLGKTFVIPNGINLKKFNSLPRQPKNKVVFGMQSRIVKIKDHETLIMAFQNLCEIYSEKEFELKIAGDGEHLPYLKKMVEKLSYKNQITFEGQLDEEGLINFLQNLDIYVHATLGETMSTAIMQAQAVGLPIIASDVNGVNNILINNLDALLVLPQNEEHLLEKMKTMLFDENLRTKFAQRSLQNRDKISAQTMFAAYKAFILN